MSYKKVAEGVEATFKIKNYARCVNLAILDREDLIYSDNYFDMLPNTEKTVLIKGKNINPNDFKLRTWLDKWEY